MLPTSQRFLILGGGGLVGSAVGHAVARRLAPAAVVLAGLRAPNAAAAQLTAAHPAVHVAAVGGNLFVPTPLAHVDPTTLMDDADTRGRVLDAVFGDEDAAFHSNTLVDLVRRHRPHVIVDCVNTATAFGYMDVWSATHRVLRGGSTPDLADVQVLAASQSTPALIRHTRQLHRVAQEVGTPHTYIKVGTTGTGGMGANILFTHSEDRPSNTLLAKTEAAFAHTGLLFLLARTPGRLTVKEVKPAAMIGYKSVGVRTVADKHGNTRVFQPQAMTVGVGAALPLRLDDAAFTPRGPMRTPVVDTGENGCFTLGEFEAITAPGQMEIVTAEHVADVVVHELCGHATGHDVLSAVDAALLSPDFAGGVVRHRVVQQLHAAAAKDSSALPSAALGRLGPPLLSKLLFEAELLREVAGTSVAAIARMQPLALSAALVSHVSNGASRLPDMAASVGVPVLTTDTALLRGPRINVPSGAADTVRIGEGDVNAWADRGWVDLRPEHCQRWQAWLRLLCNAAGSGDDGSAGSWLARPSHYPCGDELVAGEAVAWLFSNVLGGARDKE